MEERDLDERSCGQEIDYEKLRRGIYEIERMPEATVYDQAAPDFGFNILNIHGLLYKPILDQYDESGNTMRIEWPGGKPFAVCLTHDVDFVSDQYLKHLRKARSSVFTRHRGWRRFQALSRHRLRHLSPSYYHCDDPYHRYEEWLEIEKRVSARSTFFFWPGWSSVRKHHVSDCAYDMTDRVVFDGQKCLVEEMIREIDRRGWEIGLHPSWESCADLDEMKHQKERLETVIGHEIVSVRQHFLHHDIRHTPRIHELSGFYFDSTLGFNDNVGFRFGTCHPWRLYDLESDRRLSVVEVPLVVQDGALLRRDKGLRLDEDTALEYILSLAAEVEKVGGVLTLLWHANAVADKVWLNVYLRTLASLREREPWFASVREIGEHWKRSQVPT